MKKSNRIYPLRPLNTIKGSDRSRISPLCSNTNLESFNESPTPTAPRSFFSRSREIPYFSWSPRGNHKKRVGDGSSERQVNKIASQKPITTANLDRWKRTFDIVKNNPNIDNQEEDEASPKAYQKELRSQAATVNEEYSEDEEVAAEIARKGVVSSWGAFYPDTVFRSIWELTGLLFLLIQAIVTPYKLAFSVKTGAGWNIFEVIMDCFFMLDISISLKMYRNSRMLQHWILQGRKFGDAQTGYSVKLFEDLVFAGRDS